MMDIWKPCIELGLYKRKNMFQVTDDDRFLCRWHFLFRHRLWHYKDPTSQSEALWLLKKTFLDLYKVDRSKVIYSIVFFLFTSNEDSPQF